MACIHERPMMARVRYFDVFSFGLGDLKILYVEQATCPELTSHHAIGLYTDKVNKS